MGFTMAMLMLGVARVDALTPRGVVVEEGLEDLARVKAEAWGGPRSSHTLQGIRGLQHTEAILQHPSGIASSPREGP